MKIITEWIRTVLIFYFLMLIVLHLISGEQYKRFVRFVIGIIFVVMLMQPVLRVLGREEELMDMITSESFQQELTSAGIDAKAWEDKRNEAYRMQYELALQKQFSEEAKKEGFLITHISVSLKNDYSMDEIVIDEEMTGEGEAFCNYLVQIYGIEKGRIKIR